MIFSAIFGLVPWYAWLLAVAATVAVSVLGLWPVVLAVLRKIPRPVWIALAAVAAVAVLAYNADRLIKAHDQRVADTASAARDELWKAREKAAGEAYDKQLEQLQTKLDATAKKLDEVERLAAEDLERQRRTFDERFRALAAQRSTNVSQAAVDACHLTRGVIVQFNAGARAANSDGEDPPAAAAGAGREAVDAPAGVPLDRYATAVEDTQRALGIARRQVTGWQRYHHDVILPWIASATEALASCSPKGSP